jgi:hypothetical protein
MYIYTYMEESTVWPESVRGMRLGDIHIYFDAYMYMSTLVLHFIYTLK